jgi:hypothetical protein
MTPETILRKLDELYKKEEHLIAYIDKLMGEYKQLQEDKELLQMMYMYAVNKDERNRR